jgi:2-dehydro-3-deoxyphosphogluconate aldolase/(4S)-4-hydroxy-2-oxoglutarate aldolase
MDFSTTFDTILANKIVAIIRGVNTEDVKKIVTALNDGGVKVLEITLNSPDALKTIEELNKEYGDELLIGAGTVLDTSEARSAMAAGARFIISPSYDHDVINVTKKFGCVSIPGAFTATEVLAAYKSGADIVKIFPASIGSHYIKDLRGPLPHIPLMPTGGVHLTNIKEFFEAGAVAVGIGSALVDSKQKVTDDYLRNLKNKAALFVEAASEIF